MLNLTSKWLLNLVQITLYIILISVSKLLSIYLSDVSVTQYNHINIFSVYVLKLLTEYLYLELLNYTLRTNFGAVNAVIVTRYLLFDFRSIVPSLGKKSKSDKPIRNSTTNKPEFNKRIKEPGKNTIE